MTIVNIETHDQLREIIEDSVEYWCNDNMQSGELAWKIIECIAVAKQAQMRGEID